VRIRNASTVTFSEVVLFYRVQGQEGVTFLGTGALAPDESVVFPLCTLAAMGGYSVGFFMGTQLVARIPADGGNMTAGRAAQEDPDRVNAHSDSWAITPAQPTTATYQVSITNETDDVWDEVTLFYTAVGQTAQGLTKTNVAKHEKVTFDLCPCDQLDGYVFSIFVDGLRTKLVDDALQFPPTGRMNARRALDFKTDLDPCSDSWIIDPRP
jgi:hypothetical protein